MRIPPLHWLIFAILLMIKLPIFGQEIKQHDKQLHLYAGMTIGAWGTLTVEQKGAAPYIAGLGWVTLAGAGKELADSAGWGEPEWSDFKFTIIGGCISVGIIYLINHVKKTHRKTDHR
jgi:hypothetical protein